jgi:Pentapeptide repeats (8 copies)
VLPSIDVIDHAKFDTEAKVAALPETLSLRGRRLEGAVLLGAHLRKVDLTGARLQDADLSRADLREAKLGCEDIAPPQCIGAAQLKRANLREAQLQGVNLREARLEGAHLYWARLDGAFMWDVQLQGAHLEQAILDGADMSGAQLQETKFQNASLIGVDLGDSSLWQTNFNGAKLQRADLRGSHCTEGRNRVPCDERREPSPSLDFSGEILVDPEPVFASVGQRAKLTQDVAIYDKALAPFLLDTLAADPFVLAGIAQRVAYGGQNPEGRPKTWSHRTLYNELSCGLQRRIKERDVQVEARVLYLVRILSPTGCPQWCAENGLNC